MKIDGKEISSNISTDLKKQIEKLKKKGITPKLAIIMAGEDSNSAAYVRRKEIKAKEVGIETITKRFPSDTSQYSLLTTIQQFNKDSSIHGIIVQQPLPKEIDEKAVINAVAPEKDIDGFRKDSKYDSPIALAVNKVLEYIFSSNVKLNKKNVHLRGGVAPAAHLEGELFQWLHSQTIVVIGKGNTGGKPIIDFFKKIGLKTNVIDTKTRDKKDLLKNADIIISAVGKKDVITPIMIKRKTILIGIGLHKEKDGKLYGDYEEEKVKSIVSFYTPTPGGIGPINVAMLLKNLVTAASN